MSSASVNSSKREKIESDLAQEVESINALNNTLMTYLNHLRLFKKNLIAMNDNCTELSKVNTQWVDTLYMMKCAK